LRDCEWPRLTATGFEIGVYRFDGRLFARKNHRLQQSSPVCEGIMIARAVDLIGADSAFSSVLR
jgi:hypothetical protein